MRTTISAVLISFIFLIPMMALGQQGIFQYTEERTEDLTSREAELLDLMHTKPQVVQTFLVLVPEISGIEAETGLLINLPDGEILTLQRRTVQSVNENQFRWAGEVEDVVSEVHLLVTNEGITGMVRSGNHNFDIHPIRDSGLHVLVEIDPEKFEKGLPPLMPDQDTEENGQSVIESGNAKLISDPEIRVLVAYTTNAKNNYVGNINNLISLAEGNMSDAFTTSGINADITVVHTAEINYNESIDSILNLCRLTTSQAFLPTAEDCSGYSSWQLQWHMDQIHDWRYQHNAHLVVLITGSGGAGIGWMPAFNNYAFSIARYDVVVSNHAMAHEIGHNLAAAHDTTNAQQNVFPYGHGYVYHPGEWATIMAYPPPGYTQINRYSNPDKTFGGVPTGTAELEDNVRAMNNRVGFVSNFNPPGTPLSAVIMGLPLFNPGETGFWSANVNGGDPPYSYTWQRSYSSSSGPWSQVGTSSSYSQTVTHDMWLLLNVSDSGSQSDSDIMQINVTSCTTPPCPIPKAPGGGESIPEHFALSQNHPNPFNPSTTISYDLPERSDVRLEVFNMLGQRVALLVAGQVQPGSHTAVFDASNLSSGTYLLRIDAQGSSGARFNRTMGMQLVK